MTSWMFQWHWYDITASTAKADIGVEIEDEESIMFIVAKNCNELETKRGIYVCIIKCHEHFISGRI
jgi:hypothetical protein